LLLLLAPLAGLVADAPLLQPELEVSVLSEEVSGEVEEVFVLSPARHLWADEGRLGRQQSLQLLLEVEGGEVDLSPLRDHPVTRSQNHSFPTGEFFSWELLATRGELGLENTLAAAPPLR